MPEILQAFSIERRLYTPEGIPWALLLAESNIARLRDRYKLKAFQQEVTPAGLVARLVGVGGEFVSGPGTQAVQQLAIEPTTVQVHVTGDSEDADAFLSDLGKVLYEIDPLGNFSKAKEVARTYQTMAVVRLSVPFDALLSAKVLRFLEESVKPVLAVPRGQPEISLERLSWSV